VGRYSLCAIQCMEYTDAQPEGCMQPTLFGADLYLLNVCA